MMEICRSRLQGWAADSVHKLGRLVVGLGRYHGDLRF